MLALKEAVADALVAIDLIQTLGVIVARIRFAFVDVDHAILASKAGRAGASERIDAVVTFASVATRILGAIVHVDFAVLAIEAFGTLAVVIVDQIAALSPVLARFCLALVDVYVAVFPRETGEAIALEIIDQIHAACSVLAGFALFAFVDFSLTKRASESGFAIALYSADFGFPYTILSVTVFFAVQTDQMFVSGDRVVHACVPVVDVTGGRAVTGVARNCILGSARTAFVAENSILPPVVVSALRSSDDVVIWAFEVQFFIKVIDFVKPLALKPSRQ